MRYLESGCTLLDLVLGGNKGVMGIPEGKILNIVGDKSSGKTFLSMEILARAFHTYKKLLKYNVDDAESGNTFNTKHLFGFDAITEDTLTSHLVEEWDSNMHKFLKTVKEKEIGIYILDSLDGLSNKDIEERGEARFKAHEAGKDFDKGTYGMQTPKFLSQEFFRTKTRELESTSTLLIIVSQVRDNIDPMSFKKFARSGGKALDFYAHTCLWLTNIKTIEKEGRAIGVIVKAYGDKSKTPRPYRECYFPIYFDYGIDNIGANLDYLYDLRVNDEGRYTGNLQKSRANNIRWDGKPINVSGVKTFLEANNLWEKVREGKKGAIALKTLLEFIDEDAELKAKFNAEFGSTMTREELITKIEQDPKLEKELEQRVIDKWEAIEQSILLIRKKKYE